MIPPSESAEPVRPDQAAGPAGGPGRFRFDGKVALVTGGGGAIGSAVARALGEHGAEVAVLDFQEDAAEQVAEEIRRLGRQARAILCDVRNQEFVQQAVAQVVDELGRLDVVVHTACYSGLRPLVEMTLAEFQENLHSCLTGAFIVSHAVGRVMIGQGRGGSLVHISSIASARALGRGTGAYAAAKAGLNALVRELAVEWAPHRIRVNAVAPCQVRTPSLDRLLDSGLHGGREALTSRMLAAIPLGRLAEPEDMVGPCLFLASGAASMVTGQILFADGGNTAQ